MQLAEWFKQKHNAYCTLMHGVHLVIIGMVHENKRARQEKANTANPFAKKTEAVPKIEALVHPIEPDDTILQGF